MVLILGTISGCYPVDDLLVEDLDVAATLYDKAYYSPESGTNGFNELLTFEVVDTIIHVVAPGDDDNISRNYDEYVLEQLRLNLLKLGFVEEPNPDLNPPDVAVTVTALMSEHEVYYWYPYWGWYWGYYPYSYMRSGTDFEATTKSTTDTYYYYYPWYPYSTYYTYQSGTVLMEMVDVARIDPDVEKIPVIWAGIVNGVMESSQTPMKERISKGIDQCFEQSPYLIKTLDN
jgi:hypothetical protein